ncbi:MAG: hypothetical protein UH241_00235 [Acutalibacteraceae bacterium]|nr:hypothetical protein [Acutalibacteraceae bacterium]
MKQYNLLKKITSVAITATVALSTTAFSVSAVENEKTYIIDEFLDIDHGISMESTSDEYRYLNVTLLSEKHDLAYGENSAYENIFCEDYIKDIYRITTYDGNEDITQLNTEATLRFKSDDPNLHIISLYDSYSPVDVQAEYIDGSYVFKTNRLGDFALSTKPLENKEYTFSEQTITDKDTGIVIKGMLPEGVKLDVNVNGYGDEVLSDDEGDGTYDRETPDFSKVAFFPPHISDFYTINHNANGTFYSEYGANTDFTGSEPFAVRVDIVFFDDLRIVEIDSPLTITLPLYYREFAEQTKVDEIDTHIIVLQSFPFENKLEGIKLLPKEESPEGSLVVETNSTGTFFIGNRGPLNKYLHSYGGSLDDIKLYDATSENTDKNTTETATALDKADKDETSEVSASSTDVPVLSNMLVMIIAGILLVIIIAVVVFVIIKKVL